MMSELYKNHDNFRMKVGNSVSRPDLENSDHYFFLNSHHEIKSYSYLKISLQQNLSVPMHSSKI